MRSAAVASSSAMNAQERLHHVYLSCSPRASPMVARRKAMLRSVRPSVCLSVQFSWNSTGPFFSKHPRDTLASILARMSRGCYEETGPVVSILSRSLDGDMRASPFHTHSIGGHTIGCAASKCYQREGAYHFAARYLSVDNTLRMECVVYAYFT